MRLTVMRHGHDEYDATFRDDHALTNLGYIKCKKLFMKMLSKHRPDLVLISPFQRCRDTADVLLEVNNNIKGQLLDVYINTDLSRYFPPKERENPSCYGSTFNFGIPINEGSKNFRIRVKQFCRQLEKEYGHKNMHVLIITHTLVLKEMAEHFKIDVPHWIPFLHHFTIKVRR